MSNGSMLSSPGDPAHFAALLADAVPPPPLWEGTPAPEPIDGWGPEEQWADLVGTSVPDLAEVSRSRVTRKPSGVTIESMGPSSWRVETTPGTFIFRSVEVHRELHADVEVWTGDVHVLRSGTGLGLTSRKTLAAAIWDRVRKGVGTQEMWLDAVHDATHAVLEEVEKLGNGIDLRFADLSASGSLFAAEPLVSAGATLWVGPGEMGKSTLSRGLAVSIASGRLVIPGVIPRVVGPVVYVASEAAAPQDHIRSIEAICRGAGITRSQLLHRVELVPTRGQPLHRIARSISERHQDAALIIIDSMQGLLPMGAEVRDGAALFWNAVDEIGVATLVIAHPNRSEARNWDQTDGRAAGAEVHRDRPRLLWSAQFRNEPAVAGTSFRRYTMSCAKSSNGPRPPDLSFGVGWRFGMTDRDPGVASFVECEAVAPARSESERLTKAEQGVVDALREGAVTDADIAERLGISVEAAKKRRQRLSRDITGHPGDI